MHGPIKVKSPNNTSKWHMGFNSTFEGLKRYTYVSMERRTQFTIKYVRVCVCLFVCLSCRNYTGGSFVLKRRVNK
jgi:hypothetical protein